MNRFRTNLCLVWVIPALWLIMPVGVKMQAAQPAASQQRVAYQLDPSRSRFEVRTSSGGVFRAFGHDHTIAVKDFSGTAEISPAALDQSSLKLKVKASSLSLSDPEVNDKDRKEIEGTMRSQVLEVDRYPEILFTGTHVTARKISENEYEAKIEGDLQLHGVTRHEVIPAHLVIHENELRAKGEFILKQSDYAIKPVSAGGGTVKVKNEVKFSFEIIGVHRP
ncbi:MAG: YceI family protein [Acidobacteriia bacterium]|nr:YceI family protein [Terriglobia bacterium]